LLKIIVTILFCFLKAAEKADLERLELLIKSNANLDLAVNKNQRTPLIDGTVKTFF
jgi:hypothetical protein